MVNFREIFFIKWPCSAKMKGKFYLGSNLLAKLIDGTKMPMANSNEQNERKEGEEGGSKQMVGELWKKKLNII